jgi:CheY-like chemotaxis protein
VRLDLKLADGPLACELDPAQLETSLLNLAVNARDAMPHGGTFTLSLDSEEATPENDTTSSAGWVTIKAMDTGMGMHKEIAARAFEPFFTTKEIGRGSGLGLSQVYGFVNQSGGSVSIASAPGEGTTVSVRLPRSGKPLPERELEVEGILAVSGSGETVLLVEDDAAVLELGRALLDDLGYSVIPATHADAALEILRNGQKVDVLFTDVVMPGGMTGVELAQEARALRPNIKILLTSGYTGETIDRQELGALELPIIAKPFEKASLGSKLRGLLVHH